METRLAATEKGIESFLSGKWVEGIGEVYARKLTEKYGLEAVSILRDNPGSISGIVGLGSSRLAKASESLAMLPFELDLALSLYSCDIPEAYIEKIFRKYKKKTREVLTSDPYQMIEDVWRLSFFVADKIGRAMRIPDDDPRRLRGAILTSIKHYAENGHLFATPTEAIQYASMISGVSEDKFNNLIESLLADKRVVESRGGLYLPVYYKAEKNGAKRLMELASTEIKNSNPIAIPTHDIKGHRYTSAQIDAIRMAIENPVIVLTGGPGSGKTTVLKGILDYFDEEGLKCTLVAPTGRAAKRISALTGHDAFTIHHLLGYREGEGYRNKKLDTDVLVIDESSMLEQVLFDHLLEAINPNTRIIIIGDVDQLPAIGAGDVLRDLIDSQSIPVARLNENFRQKSGSMIAANAIAINKGDLPESADDDNFLIINESGIKNIHDRVLSLVKEELPAKYSISPSDIQVVTPQQMGPLGARQLNIDLQTLLNGNSPGIKRGASVMRLGDPVMQTSNSRERGLYNGEIGRIVELDPEENFLIVEFSGERRSKYNRSDLSELILAYATTVHKLQGSEIEYMVMPLSMSHRPMLYRNLLYTGVSRAKKICALVGEEEALRYAVENNRDTIRNSNFSRRLQDKKMKDLPLE